jgi:glucose-1-phosphate adenylyltransferase
MKKQIVGMVLAGGRVDELSVLTAKRPKSAVPIWGMYRFIDFVLSNMMHSGIDVVGVLSQYRPYSLNTHLAGGAPWDFVGRTRELKVLSPFLGSKDTDWYRGTADAIYQNLIFIEHYSPELVLIASADHVYSMDYRPMIRQHLATGAELTLALKEVPAHQAPMFGTAVLDERRRVVLYEEKSVKPKGNRASLTIYVFNTATLVERLRENAATGTTFQLYSEIIPRMVAEGARVFGYLFDGYWQYARTLDAYYAANMDIIGPDPPDLEAWQVRTNLTSGTLGDPTPALFRPTATVHSSLICPGAWVEGTVEASIVSPNVVIERGAVVRNSILMHGCHIAAGAFLDTVILDKSVTVGCNAQIGVGPMVANSGRADLPTSGVTVVGKGTTVPPRTVIGRNCILWPDIDGASFPARTIPSATVVRP